MLDWLADLRPIWELRYPEPPPDGVAQRRLLRPVWWLGAWQFACLDYYHPPHVQNRCVEAEPWPPCLRPLVPRMEGIIRDRANRAEIPSGWRLNTALVNFYGDRLDESGRWVDEARVGDHRDFEPGPVASLSLGDRALFQFVDRGAKVREQVWLADGDFQWFSGPDHKDRWFHRVPRVERSGRSLPPELPDFRIRRVNITFRYVPPDAIVKARQLPTAVKRAVAPYLAALGERSPWWATQTADPRS